MILETSAIIAILFKEPVWRALLGALERDETLSCGAPTLAEAGTVLGVRRGFEQPHLQRFIQEFDVATLSFTELHWAEAVRAYDRFGKGRHEARLNFGDCLSYATAKLAKQPLLCVGEDFVKTDLELVAF